ncbi:MAG: sigma-54-dependent transcriptional regulator [Acidobacteriota bacterium]
MAVRKPVLLLVDDNEAFRRSLTAALSREYEVQVAASRAEARQLVVCRPDAVLLDLRLDDADPANAEGLEFLRELRRDWTGIPVVMITGYGDVATAVECMREGAVDFVEKVADLREIRARLERALEHAHLVHRMEALEEELRIVAPRELVGDSPQMREVKALVAAAAQDASITVLIEGETGTGKELVARAIHASGPRRSKPFVAVAIAALPATMVESELFGYEKGAFTGAERRHIGHLERAHGGVLFLDEIDELEPSVQVKLLRFLQERVLTRLGGAGEIPVDVQIVAATNEDLRRLVQEGKFREDLYHRLRVFEIRLPALRDRRNDISLLVNYFFQKLGGPARGLSGIEPAASDLLCRYRWPGNVRELRNTMERAILKAGIAKHRRIEVSDLPAELKEPAAADTPYVAEDAALEEALARTELAEVERALEKAGGKKTEAWKLLGLNDRYALRRRVLRLLENYPSLADQFPRVRAAYPSTSARPSRTGR